MRQNTKDDRFESDVDGGTAFVEYVIDGDQITFTHTEVPKQAEVKGAAGKLVAEATLTPLVVGKNASATASDVA